MAPLSALLHQAPSVRHLFGKVRGRWPVGPGAGHRLWSFQGLRTGRRSPDELSSEHAVGEGAACYSRPGQVGRRHRDRGDAGSRGV